jgi:hypothetical protein
MYSFIGLVKEWQVFYEALATASATLAGLVFVGVTFNANTLTREGGKSWLTLAFNTFEDLLMMLIISLFFLVPNLSHTAIACVLFSNAPLSLVRVLLLLKGFTRKNYPFSSKRFIVLSFVFPSIVFVGVVLTGLGLIFGHYGYLYLLLAVLTVLLVSASRTAWALLTIMVGKN